MFFRFQLVYFFLHIFCIIEHQLLFDILRNVFVYYLLLNNSDVSVYQYRI